jgi:hypothetical protein
MQVAGTAPPDLRAQRDSFRDAHRARVDHDRPRTDAVADGRDDTRAGRAVEEAQQDDVRACDRR